MDDPENGKFCRLPTLEDLITACKHLNESGAKYILIGGFAVAFHGFARGTKGIDFLVDPAVENILKIKSALSYLPDKAIHEMNDTDVAKYNVVRVADEFMIDLLAKACSISYEQGKNEVDIYEIENVDIPIASKELLIKTKDTIRPGDKMDVDFLKAAIAREKEKK